MSAKFPGATIEIHLDAITIASVTHHTVNDGHGARNVKKPRSFNGGTMCVSMSSRR